ncbi:MAG: preprotein translocase subunit SecE [Planctomycetota bacterium]
MALAMYKPGQGYWTRAMTAVFGGVLVLAAAAWLYGQGVLIPLPDRAWNANYLSTDASVEMGDTVTLLGQTVSGERPALGTAAVESVEVGGSGGLVTLVDMQVDEGVQRPQVQALRTASGTELAIDGGVRGVPIVDRIYVQGGLVLVTVLLGASMLLYFVAVRRSSVDFLIATDGEMRKVNWSTRKDVIGSTWVVIGASLLLGICLFLVDTVFATVFRQVGVLDG